MNKKKQLENIACPLCGTFDDYVLARRAYPNRMKLNNVICKNCGLIRINPRLTKESYEKFYQEEFFEFLNPYSRPAYVQEIEHTLDEAVETPTKKMLMPYLREYVPEQGNVLDVGAGFGQVLYLFKKEKGAKVVGLEPDPKSRQVAKEKIGIDLLDKTVERYLDSNPQDKFDLIVLNQTFEHLLYPLEALKGLARLLKPQGVIYIGVPNTMDSKIPMWLFYSVAHTYNYTPHTFGLFAVKAGLKIIKIGNPHNPYQNALEGLFALPDSDYAEVDAAALKPGEDWREVVKVLRRKRFLNIVRGGGKRVLKILFGQKLTEKIREKVDQITGYRY